MDLKDYFEFLSPDDLDKIAETAPTPSGMGARPSYLNSIGF